MYFALSKEPRKLISATQLAWYAHFLGMLIFFNQKKPSALMYFALLKETRKLISPTPEIILISVLYFGFM